MTAQISEIIIYLGSEMSLNCEPLRPFLETLDEQPEFAFIHTGLWRVYVGTWEIIEERLYLKELEGALVDNIKVSINTFFPDASDKVFAYWFSGLLQLPFGKELFYKHDGYGNVYESEALIEVEKGLIIKTTMRHNSQPEKDEVNFKYPLFGIKPDLY